MVAGVSAGLAESNGSLPPVLGAAQMVRTDAALLGALANGGCVVSHNSVYLFLPSFKLIIASLCRSSRCIVHWWSRGALLQIDVSALSQPTAA